MKGFTDGLIACEYGEHFVPQEDMFNDEICIDCYDIRLDYEADMKMDQKKENR
jgi:hypothetical protein